MYGGGLDAYCMLRTVLDEGLPAERLKLVVPRGSRPAFSNQEVTDSMSSRIEELGVKVISGVELTGFEVDGGEHLSALQLNEVESLPCAALVWLHDKQVDRKLFEGYWNC